MSIEIKNVYSPIKLQQEIIFNYCGSISQPLLGALINEVEIQIERYPNGHKASRNIFELVIEMSQNIINYSANRTSTEDNVYTIERAEVALSYSDGNFFISSANLINRSKMEKLQETIEYLNTLQPDELKKLYRQQRRSGDSRHSRGAGLGLIDLARKSSADIEFQFEDVGSNLVVFSLQVQI
jgi:hypothetical protein